MPTLILFAGINGAGKSTFFLTNAWRSSGVPDKLLRVNPDEILVKQHGSATSEKDQLKAAKEAVRQIDKCFSQGISFNQETTLSSLSSVRNVRKAKEAGFDVLLYYIGVDTADIAIKRIAHRAAIGGHDIDSTLVRKRFNKSLKNLSNILDYCDEATIINNTTSFKTVAKWKNGMLSWVGNLNSDGKWLQTAIQDCEIWRKD